MITSQVLAWQLCLYRKRAQIKQDEAAKVLDLDATAITKIENNKRSVSALELVQLAHLYKVDVNTLLGETMKDPKSCEHWEMVFCVVERTIYVRCMTCHLVASVKLDGVDKFTTHWAKTALDTVRDQP